MTKQEQIEKMSSDMKNQIDYECSLCDLRDDEAYDDNFSRVGIIIHYDVSAENLINKGYISGIDFVRQLEKEIDKEDFLEGKKFRTKMLINRVLQEYLSSEETGGEQ